MRALGGWSPLHRAVISARERKRAGGAFMQSGEAGAGLQGAPLQMVPGLVGMAWPSVQMCWQAPLQRSHTSSLSPLGVYAQDAVYCSLPSGRDSDSTRPSTGWDLADSRVIARGGLACFLLIPCFCGDSTPCLHLHSSPWGPGFSASAWQGDAGMQNPSRPRGGSGMRLMAANIPIQMDRQADHFSVPDELWKRLQK